MMMRWPIVLLSLMFALGGCATTSANSTSPQAGAPTKTPKSAPLYKPVTNACLLVSAAEVMGVVQVAVQAQSSTVQGLATCTYVTTTTTQQYVQTNINIEPSIDAAQNDFADQQEGADVMGVPGVGDAAFFDGDETLTVLQKNAIATVILHMSSVQKKLDDDTAVARLVIQRLS